jgi:chromosome condensin MukBEF ATPase and DNA-binding subunit MukB
LRKQLFERRRLLIEIYVKTWSLRKAIEVVSKRFQVSEATLRVDWQRRPTWLKEVFEQLSDPTQNEFYLIGIHESLAQIDRELKQTSNPSCRVGLLKTKIDVLFRLVELQNLVDNQALAKRVEEMERKLEFLESEQKRIG